MLREPAQRRSGPAWNSLPWVKKARALVLGVLIVFNVIAAYPMPGGITLERLKDETARKELERWVERLQALGIDTDRERLGRAYVRIAGVLSEGKNTLVAPVIPLMDLTGTHQGWRLFAMPNERPHALRVAGERRGKTRILYESSDPEHRLLAELLEYRRVRALYNPSAPEPPGTYETFARRLSERVFAERPKLDAVVVSLVRRRTTLPGEPPDLSREERFQLTFPRARR